MHKPILYDSHMHTPLCNHAKGEPEEYAAVAELLGLKGIIFTCHNPIDDSRWGRGRMRVDQLDTYVRIVARAREAWAGRVDVRLGLECDYAPGMEPWLNKLLRKAEFHHILGSVHPHNPRYKERFFHGNMIEFQKTYFEHLAMAAETRLFDTISHPDLVKNVSPPEWNPDNIMDAIGRSLDRIAAAGTAMELNTSGLNKKVPEMNPGPNILAEMRKRNIPVVVNSDAHKPERVADKFDEAFKLLSQAGYTHTNIFLNRERHEIPIDIAQTSLLIP
ncbi:MAG: histidinol-phosphatase [Chloroflexota bacterium]